MRRPSAAKSVRINEGDHMTQNTAGGGTYFKRGSWNAVCDRCGRDFKAEELRQDWQGLMLCAADWEPRHPQDFVRARNGPDPAPVPWTRGGAADVFVSFCTPNGASSYADAAIAGCWIAEFTSPMFDPTIY